MNGNQGNICKICKHKFRRLFIPMRPENYSYPDGNTMAPGEENIIILNQCLITGMDIDGEATIECSHFSEIEKIKNDYRSNFFKDIK